MSAHRRESPERSVSTDLIEQTQRHSAAADAVLLGRETFEAFRGFWPKQADDQTGVTDYLNRVRKYVVSSTMTDPEWENSGADRQPDLPGPGSCC